MLFHSPYFLFAFLPVTLLGFFAMGRFGSRSIALVWLTCASLFFYAFWNPAYLWLLGASIIANFLIGTHLSSHTGNRKLILILGIAANLVLLAYFKYAHFFLETANMVLGTGLTFHTIVLPLGISFITFEQIAWLVETYRGDVLKTTFVHYCAFITNFTKLIAGPIIRPHELLPQMKSKRIGHVRAEDLSIGLTIFMIGLFKKVVLADTVALFASPVFAAAAQGTAVAMPEAWGALLAYALQIYFDFSGYTDMAIGLARMMGFVLPLNFDAPYKSLSIIDFWRRWHMSLSRFIRDYVYIPLGGSRRGKVRQWINLFIIMVLVGLWHGAGWTFVVWGALHGIFMIINHWWRFLQAVVGWAEEKSRWWSRGAAWFITFFSVLIAWVFFRSETMGTAFRMIRSLFGMNGLSLPGILQKHLGMLSEYGVRFDLQNLLILTPGQWVQGGKWILVLLVIALFFPTTQQFMRHTGPALDAKPATGRNLLNRIAWHPTKRWALFLAGLTCVTVIFLMLSEQSEFLYFQF